MAALVQKSKIDENNQCQWTVEKRLCLFCTETQHDLSSVLEKSAWLQCGKFTILKVKVLEAARVLGD